MDFALPAHALCPKAMAATLEVLAGTTDALTGRQVARLVRSGSQQAVLDALGRLAENGVVNREIVGKTHLYRLNREHLAAPAVEILAGLFANLVERLGDTLGAWDPKPRHASLFGSAARREASTMSDIDILLVRRKGIAPDDPEWTEQKEALASHALRWSGNPISWLDLSQAEVKSALRSRDPLLDELKRDGVHLAGTRFRSLLRELS